MHALHPNTEFRDDETGCTPHWSRANPGSGPRSIIYPRLAPPEWRQFSPRPVGPPAPAGERPVTGAAAPGLTPSQWLSQWCCLEEQT